MSLVEQLRANILEYRMSPLTEELMGAAADTIEAQSRLLTLAKTLAGAVAKTTIGIYPVEMTLDESSVVAKATTDFFDAQAEYQTTGTVPCGECEKWEAEQTKVIEHCEAHQATETRLRKEAEAERDDLRRQFESANASATTWEFLYNRDAAPMKAERDDLRRQLNAEKTRTSDLMQVLADAKQVWAEIDDRNDLRRQLDTARSAIDELTSECEDRSLRLAEAKEYEQSYVRQIREMQADNAAMIEVLEGVYHESSDTDEKIEFQLPREWMGYVKDALSRPHPGAALLEELGALRKVEEAVRGLGCLFVDSKGREIKTALTAAMDGLDAIRNRGAALNNSLS